MGVSSRARGGGSADGGPTSAPPSRERLTLTRCLVMSMVTSGSGSRTVAQPSARARISPSTASVLGPPPPRHSGSVSIGFWSLGTCRKAARTRSSVSRRVRDLAALPAAHPAPRHDVVRARAGLQGLRVRVLKGGEWYLSRNYDIIAPSSLPLLGRCLQGSSTRGSPQRLYEMRVGGRGSRARPRRTLLPRTQRPPAASMATCH